MVKTIVLYSQPGRFFCGKVKEVLSRRGVAYTERDISRDPQALDELSRLGYMTTPVTTIDGEVVAVIATSGDKGHDDPMMTRDDVVALRRAEQRRAAEILGVQRVTFLDSEDGELAWAGPRVAEDVTRAIREVRPQIVITHDPYAGPPRYARYQLHPDHRARGFAVIDAVYFSAPGPLYYPAHAAAGLAPHRAAELLLIVGEHHDHFVDITSTFGRKVAAVSAHVSQWGKHPDLEGFLRQRAQRLGEARGIALAEGFKRLVPG